MYAILHVTKIKICVSAQYTLFPFGNLQNFFNKKTQTF